MMENSRGKREFFYYNEKGCGENKQKRKNIHKMDTKYGNTS